MTEQKKPWFITIVPMAQCKNSKISPVIPSIKLNIPEAIVNHAVAFVLAEIGRDWLSIVGTYLVLYYSWPVCQPMVRPWLASRSELSSTRIVWLVNDSATEQATAAAPTAGPALGLPPAPEPASEAALNPMPEPMPEPMLVRQMLIGQIMTSMQEIGHRSRLALAQYLTSQGLQMAHWMVLHLLSESKALAAPGPTMRSLGDLVGMPPSSMTGVVDALDRHGFVERIGDNQDRRVIRLRITVAGEDFLGSIQHWMNIEYASVLSPLVKEDLMTLKQLFDRMLGHFRTLGDSKQGETKRGE
jgi:DNA-binding MarR family transcriptional regulator